MTQIHTNKRESIQVSRKGGVAILLLFSIIIFAQRFKLSAAPLYGDICAYAVLGHEMLHGRLLYSDLWERKPPLLYITYAAAERVTGYGPNEIFLLGLATSLVTMLLIYFAGNSAGRGAFGGLFAAAFWVLLNCDLDLTANQPDPETFINLCLCGSFLILIGQWPRRRILSCLMLGATLSAATLYKHNTAIVCAAFLLGQVVIPLSRKWTDRLIDSLTAGCVMIVIWIAVFGYFSSTGRAHAFVDVLFHQNAAYTGSVSKNLGKSSDLGRIFPAFMIWIVAPLLLMAVLCGFTFSNARTRRHEDAKVNQEAELCSSGPWYSLLAWAIGTWPTIALTGYFYPHYYQLWLPIGCIGGGWAAADLMRSSSHIAPIIRYATLLIAFTFLIFRQGSEFLLTPGQWVHRQFPYFDLVRQNQLGVDLGRLLKPDESLWELGEDNALYFFSKHSPPTGLLFIDPLIYGDETSVYWNRLLGDLNRTKPTLVILSDNWTQFFPVDAPIFPWLKQNYTPWDTPLGWPHYRLLVRRGSEIKDER